jgi:hypothetical protein
MLAGIPYLVNEKDLQAPGHPARKRRLSAESGLRSAMKNISRYALFFRCSALINNIDKLILPSGQGSVYNLYCETSPEYYHPIHSRDSAD